VRHHEAALTRRDPEAYVSHQNDVNDRSIRP
jgi:hypothetical protein